MPIHVAQLPTYEVAADFGEYVRRTHRMQVSRFQWLETELAKSQRSLKLMLSNASHPDESKCTMTTHALAVTVGSHDVFDFRVFGIMDHGANGYCQQPTSRIAAAAESFALPENEDFFLEKYLSRRMLVMGVLAQDVITRAFDSNELALEFGLLDSQEDFGLFVDYLVRVKTFLQQDHAALRANWEVWSDFLENFMTFEQWMAELKKVPKTAAQQYAASHHAITDKVRDNCAEQGRLYGAINGLAAQNPVSIAKRVSTAKANAAFTGVKKRLLSSRMTMSDVRKWPAEGPRREQLLADNSERALHMLAVRDPDETVERRNATASLAKTSNGFVPDGYDMNAQMMARGVLTVLHEMCEPYVLRNSLSAIPDGAIVEGTFGPRPSYAVQKAREAAQMLRMASISPEDRSAFVQLRDWGYSIDFILLCSPKMVLYVDVTKALKWKVPQKELMILAGKAAALAGDDPEAWHSDDELRQMVAMMALVGQNRVIADDAALGGDAPDLDLYGIRRLACLLMHVGRRASEDKQSAKQVGLFHAWLNYVQYRVGGSVGPWPYARYGWNPSKFGPGVHKTLYMAALQEHDAEVKRHNDEVDRKRKQLYEEGRATRPRTAAA